MSANLNENRHRPKTPRFQFWPPVIDPKERQIPLPQYSIRPVTDDEEMKFIAWAVIWIAAVAVTPLILFQIVTYFYPDVLWMLVAPN